MSDATLMLTAVERAEPQAAEQLLGLLYEALRRLLDEALGRRETIQTCPVWRSPIPLRRGRT